MRKYLCIHGKTSLIAFRNFRKKFKILLMRSRCFSMNAEMLFLKNHFLKKNICFTNMASAHPNARAQLHKI